MEYFAIISNNKETISVRDLHEFVKIFAKTNLRNDELEAILRRCDHNADQLIGFDEFCEMVSSNEKNISSPEEQDEQNYRTQTKELRKDITNSPLRKSPSKNDVYEKSIDETLEQYQSPLDKKVMKKNH